MEKLNSLICRVFFVVAFILLAVAVLERLMNVVGYSFMLGSDYQAGRLLEFAVILLVFVITVLLRQIRDELQKAKS
jgi:hypothetical protein